MRSIYWIAASAFVLGAVLGALGVSARYEASEAPTLPASADAVADIPLDAQVVNSGLPPTPSPEGESEAVPGPPQDFSARTVSPDLTARLEAMVAGWGRLDGEVRRLRQRVEELEDKIVASTTESKDGTSERPRMRTAAERQAAMEAAGVATDLAADIVWRQERYELDRLELRDQAVREDWLGTDRYREELRRLREERPDLRAELGEEEYDRYLFAAGEDNRVRVEGVIGGSAADEAGLRPGDIIEAYGGNRLFTFGELRRLTTEGELDELVPVSVRRADGTRVQAWVPRGPLGVRMGLTRADPDA